MHSHQANGWRQVRLRELTSKIGSGITPRGGSSVFVGDGVLFIRSQNIRDGRVDTSDNKYISPELDKRMSSSRVQNGDVLYNITGASIGRSAVYQLDLPANVNQHVCIIRPKNASPEFINYALTSNIGKQRLWESLAGGNREGLNFQQLGKFKFMIPDLDQQERIVRALQAWDKAVTLLERTIELKRVFKKVLRTKLVTGKMRLPSHFAKWTTHEIGEILSYEQPSKYLVADTEYSNANVVPVLTANKSFILGYTNETDGIYNRLPVIIFDDFTTDSKYVTFNFKVKSSAIKILQPSTANVNLKFVFERMQLIDFVVGQHKRNYISEYRYITIDLPPVEEQIAIAKVLTAVDDDIAALEQKLAIIKAQRKYLLNNIVIGKIRVPETLNPLAKEPTRA